MKNPLNALHGLARAVDFANEWIGRIIAWFSLAMVIITFGIVIARYGFDKGAIPVQDGVIYLHGFLFMVCAAYTLKHDGHVRVDILYSNMSDRGKAIVDLLGSLFLLMPTFGYILYSSWDYVARSWILRESSPETGGLPFEYLFKTAIVIMAVLMLLQGVSQAIHSLRRIVGEEKRRPDALRDAASREI